jgi:VRR-NUC domain
MVAIPAFRETEAQFQASVVKYAELMGWRTHHHYDSRRSSTGLPDLLLVRRPRVVWAELKSERGRLTDDQRAWIAELRACGQEAYIWRPSMWQDVERILL